jgi:hypothetical protein
MVVSAALSVDACGLIGQQVDESREPDLENAGGVRAAGSTGGTDVMRQHQPRRTGRQWIGILVVMAIGVTFSIGTAAPPVQAADPATAALADAMDTLGSVLAAGSSLQQAAEAVPFTGVAPALQSGLDMVASLQATLGQLKEQPQQLRGPSAGRRRRRAGGSGHDNRRWSQGRGRLRCVL